MFAVDERLHVGGLTTGIGHGWTGQIGEELVNRADVAGSFLFERVGGMILETEQGCPLRPKPDYPGHDLAIVEWAATAAPCERSLQNTFPQCAICERRQHGLARGILET
jgi:hypothetical protein